jgi:hypothetical protein
MEGSDGRLQLVLASRALLHGLEGQGGSFPYKLVVPQSAVLVSQRDELAHRAGPCGPALRSGA